MATSLEQRYVQEQARLGAEQGPPIQLTPEVRLWPFYNACLLEVRGDTYVLSEATVGQLFRAAPG